MRRGRASRKWISLLLADSRDSWSYLATKTFTIYSPYMALQNSFYNWRYWQFIACIWIKNVLNLHFLNQLKNGSTIIFWQLHFSEFSCMFFWNEKGWILGKVLTKIHTFMKKQITISRTTWKGMNYSDTCSESESVHCTYRYLASENHMLWKSHAHLMTLGCLIFFKKSITIKNSQTF